MPQFQPLPPEGMRTPSFSRLFLALCVVWLLLNLPLLLGKSVMPWDAMDEFYPTVYFNAHSLRLGLAPWWNPHIYSGYPQIADPQGMLFSPLLMIWMLLRQSPSPVWFTWGVLLHLLMGGTALLGTLRRIGVNAFGALAGATVFMAGGVAASRLEHTPIVVAYTYAPVVLLALQYFLTDPGIRRGALFGLAAGAMITQLVQVSYLFVLMLIGYFVAGTIWRWRTYVATSRQRWVIGIVVACICALILGLPQLLFSWAFMSLSNRTSMSLADAAGASLGMRAFLSLFMPNALHALRGIYTGPASVVEAYLYVGALPLVSLAFMPRAWCDPQQRRWLLFFIAVAFLACVYMLGVHTFFYPWLYSWLPGIQHFRRPSDGAYLLNFSLAIIIGITCGRINLTSRREISTLLVITTCWLVLASLGMRFQGLRWQAFTMTAAAFGVLALWRLQKLGSTWRSTLWLLAILVIDYRCFNLNGTFNRGVDSAHWFTTDPVVNALADDIQKKGAVLPARFESQNTRISWDDMVVLKGFLSTQGYNPLRYALYDRWYGARDNSSLPRVNTPFNPAPDSPMNKLLDVQYLVVGHQPGTSVEPAPGFVRIVADKDEDLWHTDQTYPRLLAPIHTRLLTVGAMPDAVDFAATDFGDTVWMTPRDQSDEQAVRKVASSCRGKVQATAVRATPTQQLIRTHSEQAGWVVVSELDFPGWQAELDGTSIPVHRANGMFRAVCVPAGEHDLRFRFQPWSMVAYAWQQALHPRQL